MAASCSHVNSVNRQVSDDQLELEHLSYIKDSYKHLNSDENDDSGDDPADQEQFDRISGILSALIQEANDAINNAPSLISPINTLIEMDDNEHVIMSQSHSSSSCISAASSPEFEQASSTDALTGDGADAASPTFTASPSKLTIETNIGLRSESQPSTRESRRRSRLPRPKKLSLGSIYHPQHQHYIHARSSSHESYASFSSSSSSSSSTNDDDEESLFSPIPTDLTTPMSRTISPLLFDKDAYSQMLRDEHINQEERFDSTSNRKVGPLVNGIVVNDLDADDDGADGDDDLHYQRDDLLSPNDSLMASFERLDSSLAIVDSLSRDLASYRRQQHSRSSSTSLLSSANSVTSGDTASFFIPSQNSSSIDNNNNKNNNSKKKNSDTDGIKATTDLQLYVNSSKQKAFFSGIWIRLLVLPLFYIPYMLMTTMWDDLTIVTLAVSTTVKSAVMTTLSTKTDTVSISSIYTVLSALKELNEQIFDRIPSHGITGMVPPSAGLAVFILLVAILHLLLESDHVNDGGVDNSMSLCDNKVCPDDLRQFIVSSDLSNDAIRRSSLALTSSSLSHSYSN